VRRPVRILLPGPPGRRTGGNIYDERIVDGLRRSGRDAGLIWLDGRFPDADNRARASARAALAATAGALVMIDGLAAPAFPLDALRDAWLLIHHPLALETGVDADLAERLDAAERARASAAAGILVTSAVTAATVAARFGIARDRIAVVEPGVEWAAWAPLRRRTPVEIVCVAAVTARKAQDALLRAAAAQSAPWRLSLIGDDRRDPAARRRLIATALRTRTQRRLRRLGERGAAEADRRMRRADLFVSSSLYEGFGMAIAEAGRRGLPIVAVRGGASGSVAARAGGVLVDAPAALAAALRPLLRSPRRRAAMAARARAARARFPDWRTQSARFAAALDRAGG